jgi:hypothetical protein
MGQMPYQAVNADSSLTCPITRVEDSFTPLRRTAIADTILGLLWNKASTSSHSQKPIRKGCLPFGGVGLAGATKGGGHLRQMFSYESSASSQGFSTPEFLRLDSPLRSGKPDGLTAAASEDIHRSGNLLD